MMTRYQKYMIHIHNQGTATTIESAADCLTEDIIDLLLATGVKRDSDIIKKIRSLQKYEYNHGLQDSHTKS